MSIHIKKVDPGMESICPFLGLLDDSQTSYAYPSDWNYCHHCKPLTPVALEHQKKFCLNIKHNSCPIYLREDLISLPRNLRNQRQIRSSSRRLITVIVLLITLLIILVANIGFAPRIEVFFRQLVLMVQWFAPVESPSLPTPSHTLMISTQEPTPFATPTWSLFDIPGTFTTPESPSHATLGIEMEVTPTITRIPRGLETLIGIHHIFLIHRVIQGESLSFLAYQNGTTDAAISAVNYHFTTPLWVHQIVIIPVNQTDVKDLPPFEAYRVEQDINLDALAVQLNVDPEQLRYYNSLEGINRLQQGEWLVVPREGEPAE